MIEQIRKTQIAENLAKLILQNSDLTVSELLCAVYRRRNFTKPNEDVLHLTANDEELSRALEITLNELKEQE